MTKFAEVESVEYDYLPGERQSRRVLQLVLRRPVEEGIIRIGMRVKLHIIYTPGTSIPDDRIFRVDDIHGRIIVVTPISDIDLVSDSDMRLVNVSQHVSHGSARNKYLYKNRNIVYGNGLHHYRFGKNVYTPRPNYHNSSRTYISF